MCLAEMPMCHPTPCSVCPARQRLEHSDCHFLIDDLNLGARHPQEEHYHRRNVWVVFVWVEWTSSFVLISVTAVVDLNWHLHSGCRECDRPSTWKPAAALLLRAQSFQPGSSV